MRAGWLAATGALIVAVAATGIAYAVGALAVNGTSTVAVTCVNNSTGAVRAVASSSQCTKKEHVLLLQQPVADGQTSFVVDCGAGQTIGDVLAKVEYGVERVVIQVEGTCSEQLTIDRDRVTLNAGAPGSGISAADPPLVIRGGRGIELYDLTLSGGGGLEVQAGGTFMANSLHVTGATGVGVLLSGGASGGIGSSTIENNEVGIAMWDGANSLNVWDSTIAHNTSRGVSAKSGNITLGDDTVTDNGTVPNNQGVVTENSGSIVINGGVVSGNAGNGVAAFNASNISILNGAIIEGNGAHGGVAAQDGGTVSLIGAVVRNNADGGVYGYDGGHIAIGNTTIESNSGFGVSLTGGSEARIGSSSIVHGNANDGITLGDTSVARIDSDTTITDNAGWGVFCEAAPAVAVIRVGSGLSNVSGNASGGVSCPTLH